MITREGVFLEPIVAILSSRYAAGEISLVNHIRKWGRKMMATTFLDLIVVLMWPLAFSAAAWAIAIRALAETDEISKVVEALTRPKEGGPRKRTPLRDDDRRGDHTRVAGMLRDHEFSEFALSVIARACFRMVLPVLLVAEPFAALPAHAGRFEFDQRRTEVRFIYKMAYSTQRGRFTKVTGTLDYDEAAPEKSKISASIAAASLTTGEALVDRELKSEAFFNAEASPVIAFKSLAVRPGSATEADVSGEITVNGITKPVTLKVNLKSHVDPALKYDAGAREFIVTTRIQRSAFNMTDYQSVVDDDIDIEIDAIVRPR